MHINPPCWKLNNKSNLDEGEIRKGSMPGLLYLLLIDPSSDGQGAREGATTQHEIPYCTCSYIISFYVIMHLMIEYQWNEWVATIANEWNHVVILASNKQNENNSLIRFSDKLCSLIFSRRFCRVYVSEIQKKTYPGRNCITAINKHKLWRVSYI